MRQLSLMPPALTETLPAPQSPALLEEARQRIVEKLARLIEKAVADQGQQERSAHER